MNSSTSNSEQRRFFAWVALFLLCSLVAVDVTTWNGVAATERAHQRLGRELGGKADFLIVGDSKANPFSIGCLLPWSSTQRGLVFAGNSVTPVFHYNNLLQIRKSDSTFAPRVVFIFLGANNFNANGLHAERDYAFSNTLPLGEVWDLSGKEGEYLSFLEALLSRVVPVYGKRVLITHLAVGRRKALKCFDATPDQYERARLSDLEQASRDSILDKNYLDIYRRSVYASYSSSVVVRRATEKLITLITSYGGTPMLVLPPVTPEMRALEHELIGDAFDDTVAAIAAKHGTPVLDFRDQQQYEFQDVNHLSMSGARDLAIDRLLPIVERMAEEHSAPARASRLSGN